MIIAILFYAFALCSLFTLASFVIDTMVVYTKFWEKAANIGTISVVSLVFTMVAVMPFV